MNKYRHTEMEDIYESYEWLLREKLVQLDHLSRKMFTDFGAAGVLHSKAIAYVQPKIMALMKKVVQEGDASDCGKRSTWER